jgi:hypothetical protein
MADAGVSFLNADAQLCLLLNSISFFDNDITVRNGTVAMIRMNSDHPKRLVPQFCSVRKSAIVPVVSNIVALQSKVDPHTFRLMQFAG